jgi:hypothetical protein
VGNRDLSPGFHGLYLRQSTQGPPTSVPRVHLRRPETLMYNAFGVVCAGCAHEFPRCAHEFPGCASGDPGL